VYGEVLVNKLPLQRRGVYRKDSILKGLYLDEHINGTARVANFEAEETLKSVEHAVAPILEGNKTDKEYRKVKRAIAKTTELLGFLHRLEHAFVVRELCKETLAKGETAAGNRRRKVLRRRKASSTCGE
jgi:hypothetical protein